jgi:hypothetical protein
LKAFRSYDEIKIGCATTSGTTFGNIRHNPEIMLKIYSYLPLGDRICRLSLVDRAFSRDKIRGGVVCATYGGGFNLKQALLELLHWAVDQQKKHCQERNHNHIEEAEIEQYCNERIAKICSMLKAANLNDVELLMFTGSNLTNRIVTPHERRRWMTSYIREFFAREKQQWDQQQQQQQQQQQKENQQGHSWLTEVVLVQTFLKRYFFDGNVNWLEQLMIDADFLDEYQGYLEAQKSSKNHVNKDGDLVWCLPNLHHGCTLLLLDPDATEDGGWKEHRFVTCRCCLKLHEHIPGNGFSCDHGQNGHFCDKCCGYFWFSPQAPRIGKANLVCDHCRFGDARILVDYT